MNRINFFRVTAQPDHHHGLEIKTLTFTIDIDGQEHHFSKVVQPDDLTSFLDDIFEYAKREFKRYYEENK